MVTEQEYLAIGPPRGFRWGDNQSCPRNPTTLTWWVCLRKPDDPKHRRYLSYRAFQQQVHGCLICEKEAQCKLAGDSRGFNWDGTSGWICKNDPEHRLEIPLAEFVRKVTRCRICERAKYETAGDERGFILRGKVPCNIHTATRWQCTNNTCRRRLRESLTDLLKRTCCPYCAHARIRRQLVQSEANI
jgi:hypothetical protein